MYVPGLSPHVHLKYKGGVFLLGCTSEERKENVAISLRSFYRAMTSLISAQLWSLSDSQVASLHEAKALKRQTGKEWLRKKKSSLNNKRHSRKREKEKSHGDRTNRKEELMKDWEEDNMPTETHEHHKQATDRVFSGDTKRNILYTRNKLLQHGSPSGSRGDLRCGRQL